MSEIQKYIKNNGKSFVLQIKNIAEIDDIYQSG
jgi:hypothetical protein